MNQIHAFKNLYLILLILSPAISFGQPNNQEIEKMIDQEIKGIKEGNKKTNDYRFDSSNEKHFFNYIKKYEKDKDPDVHFLIQRLKYRIGINSNDTLLRQRAVEDFIADLVIDDQSASQYALNRLLIFKERDYSGKARQMLSTIFMNKKFKQLEFLFICGTAQVKELIPDLRKIAAGFNRKDRKWDGTIEWYATLALARLGDTINMDGAIASVELILDQSRKIRKLEDLAYTRHPDCIKLLYIYLESNDKQPDIEGGIEGKMIGDKLNRYVILYLSKYLEKFPIELKERWEYTEKDIEVARKYLKQKYLFTKD